MAPEPSAIQRVLVVDGDVLVRHVISDYLRSCGYRVVEGATTDEALVIIEQAGISLDAMLCDAEAPGSKTAFEMHAIARVKQPQAKLILAGNVANAAGKAAELCEEGPQLKRPYDPQGVVNYIKRILGARENGRVSEG